MIIILFKAAWYLCPPWKRGHIVLQLSNGRYVGRSVCRPCVVRSISFDPFTWLIPNLVQGLPLMSRWSLLIFKVTCSKVKVKPLFSVHGVVRSISFDPFTWSIPNFVQGLHPVSRWSLLIFRAHIQRSRSKYSSKSSVLSTIYILIPCLLVLWTDYASTEKINLHFASWGAYMFLNLTKVWPLFTLSHRGSDNSPLMIVFMWTLYELCLCIYYVMISAYFKQCSIFEDDEIV